MNTEKIIRNIVSIGMTIFLVTFTTYAAISYPSSIPDGETLGWKFQDNFNKIFWSVSFSWWKIWIGTTTPTQMLEVNGNTIVNGIIESTSGWIKFPNGTIQTSAAGSSWTPSVSIYQCPSWKTSWANPGGGAWWYYWCTWQISSISTCRNIEYPWNENRNCTYLWKIMISP